MIIIEERYHCNLKFKSIKCKPGHNLRLHFLVSMASPMQAFPPCAGAGSEHSRMRFRKPPSHVFEQEPHEDQGDQLPFTKQR